MEDLKDARVLVTGSDGFIGSHVVEELVRAGEPVLLDHPPPGGEVEVGVRRGLLVASPRGGLAIAGNAFISTRTPAKIVSV